MGFISAFKGLSAEHNTVPSFVKYVRCFEDIVYQGSITFTQQLYKEMPTFEPSDSFTSRQLYTKVNNLVLCCVTLSDSLMTIPCGPKHIEILSVKL